MAVAALSPLSLAYLIEISFVLNLAYHELKTFTLRDGIRDRAKEIEKEYDCMWDKNTEDLMNPELKYLKEFHTGNDRNAWEGKWRCPLYKWLIRSSADRWVVRGFMVLDVVILFACTLKANVSIPSWTHDINILFGLSLLDCFMLLTMTIVVPTLFMILIRLCRKYALGFVEEEPFCQEDNALVNKGRVNELSQQVLKKALALAAVNESLEGQGAA